MCVAHSTTGEGILPSLLSLPICVYLRDFVAGVRFGTTQHQWSKSINFSVHILPNGKGGTGNGSSRKEPISPFHRDVNSELLQSSQWIQKDREEQNWTLTHEVGHQFSVITNMKQNLCTTKQALKFMGWLGLIFMSFLLSVFLIHRRFPPGKLPSVNIKIPK